MGSFFVSWFFALVVGSGGQIGDLGTGGLCVYLWWWGPCLVCLQGLVGTGVSWLNFLLFFYSYCFFYYTLYSFMFTSSNIAELSNKLN